MNNLSDEQKRILSKNALKLRFGQKIINESYKKGMFKAPVHLAFGHEAIGVSVDYVRKPEDSILLSHRNIHYNLLRTPSISSLMNEYLLSSDGISQGKQGSMNLNNPDEGIIYTSSILGNNLCVASGVALAEKIKKQNSVTFVVTGDGAMEEGSFYESLVFMKSTNSPAVIIIENNEWSLGTKIDQRRHSIDIKKLASSIDVEYQLLEGNDLFHYTEKLEKIRQTALESQSPVCVEVKMVTLGHWIMTNDDNPNGKYINYHAGPAPEISTDEPFLIENSNDDPIFVLKNAIDEDLWNNLKVEIEDEISKENLS